MGVVREGSVRWPAEPQETPREVGVLLEQKRAPAPLFETHEVAVDIENRRVAGRCLLQFVQHQSAVDLPDLVHPEDFLADIGRRRFRQRGENAEIPFPDPAPAGLQIASLVAVDLSGIGRVGSVPNRQIGDFPFCGLDLGLYWGRGSDNQGAGDQHARQECRRAEWD